MGPVILLRRAFLQHPFLGWSKALFLTSSVSYSRSLLLVCLEQEGKAGAASKDHVINMYIVDVFAGREYKSVVFFELKGT